LNTHTHTHKRTLFFYENKKLSVLERDKQEAGSCVIFYVN